MFIDPGSTVTDNVDVGLTATVTGAVDTSATGLYNLTYTVSDSAGNAATSIVRSVSVQDSAAPVVTVPANIIVAATNASGSAKTVAEIAAFLQGATASDAVDGPIAIVSNDAPVVFPLGLTTVTFSATDLSGNIGQSQATVNVIDQTAPIITLIGASTITLNVGDVFTDQGSVVTDNVDVGLSVTPSGAVNTAAVGSYTLIYDISDAAGNAAITVTRDVVVEDNVPPVVIAPANITVAAVDANGTANTQSTIVAFLNAASASDAVDGPRTVTHDAPAIFPLNLTTVTFTATDLSGNIGSATATVNVTDQTAPEITLIGASSITLNVGDVFIDPGSNVTDNVDTGLIATVTGTVDTTVVASYTLTYAASDAAGNTALTVTRQVIVVDDAAPVITAPASITVAATDANGTARTVAVIDAFLQSASATDSIDGARPVINDAPALFPLNQTTVVTFTASDLSGNVSSATASVTVTDQTAPVITLIGASSIMINVGDAFIDPGSSVVDNVDTGLNAIATGSVNSTVPSTYLITYNISDAAGNAAISVKRSVIVQDNVSPVVTAPANIIVAATDMNGTARTVAEINTFLQAATAQDAQDGSLSVTHDAPQLFPLGATTVTFTATDLSGNIATASASVTVNDLTPPLINLIGASSITLNVGDHFIDPGHSVSDNVDSGLIATVISTVDTSSVGLYTLTYSVSDLAGNAAIPVIRNVSVQDSGAPVVTAPASITVAATDASGTAKTVAVIDSYLQAATATDAIDGSVAVTNDAPAVFPLNQTTTVTFSAQDLSGNIGQSQSTVLVIDQTRPVITLSGQSSITLSVGEVFTDPGHSVRDNVDVGLTATVVSTVDTGVVGLYTLTYNVSDAAGNAALEVIRNISVQDNAAPVVTAPANIIVAATDANGTASTEAAIQAFLNAAVATDAVDGPIASINNDAPTIFPLGSTAVTFSATDLSGNIGQSQATVTVNDQTAPLITLIGASVITLNVGDAFSDPGSNVTDNVDVGLSATATGTVDTSAVGSYILSYTVSDAAGNAALEVTRTVSVVDNVAPVVTAPVNIMVAASDASGTAATNSAISSFLNAATASDLVDGVITAITHDAPAIFPLGQTSVSFSAQDLSGNTGSAQAMVNVTDQTAPIITLIGASSISINVGDGFVDPGSRVSDNVDQNLSASVTGSVNTAVAGTYVLTYQAADSSGNVSITLIRTVTVADVVVVNHGALQFSAASYSISEQDEFNSGNQQVQITVSRINGSDGAVSVDYFSSDGTARAGIDYNAVSGTLDFLDGELSKAFSIVIIDDSVFEGTLTLMLNLTNPDGGAILGNTTLAQLNILDDESPVVVDTVKPVVTAPADIDIDATGWVTTVNLGEANATDNVDGVLVAHPDNTGPFKSGRHEIIWSATDASGNTGATVQVVRVRPIVEFSADQYATAGEKATIRVLLNGKAAVYPVTIDYEVFNDIHLPAISSGVITIHEGKKAELEYRIPAHIQTGEITFKMGAVTNAVRGALTTHKISLLNENVEPIVSLRMTQNGKLTRRVTSDGGPVSVSATILDSNIGDSHHYDWSATDNVLLALNPSAAGMSFDIDPSGLSRGFYKVAVKVTDNGIPSLDAEVEVYLQVTDRITLNDHEDSDGDGHNDRDEGDDDEDDDGIPDYLDGLPHNEVIQGRQGNSKKWLLNVQPGMKIRLGKISLFSGHHKAHVSKQDIEDNRDKFSGRVPADANDDRSNVGGYFDFEINGLTKPGQSVYVIIPQLSAIPDNAVYRKYSEDLGWKDFTQNNRNKILSAPGEEGVCPAAGEDHYVAGLMAGYHCVQLIIEDGGPNDEDGRRNGVVVDPGGVALNKAVTQPQQNTSGSGGGSVSLTTLIYLCFVYGCYCAVRRKKAIQLARVEGIKGR